MAFLQPPDSAPGPRKPEQDLPGVDVLRQRARRRLAGAVLLVLLAVLCVPLVFDAEPRPIPADIPLDMPGGSASATPGEEPPEPAPEDWIREAMVEPPDAFVAMPPDQPAYTGPPAPADQEPIIVAPAPQPVPLTPPPLEPAIRVAAVRPDAAPPAVAPPVVAPPPVATTPAAKPPAAKPPAAQKQQPPQKKPERKPAPKPQQQERAARAQDLLEGRSVAVARPADKANAATKTPPGARGFVVQVGAFADAAKAREVRASLQLEGFKAFTERAAAASGQSVTRVRLGTFSSRQEAEDMAARVKAKGLPATVMAL